MPTIVWPGSSGESYTNNTGKILYQVHCLWHNTCSACAQYDLVIVEWFSQLHHNCQCYIVPIMPGDTGAVYHDWRQTIQDLPEGQQKELMGASNWKLYQEGVVQWEDIVHETHILTLREVVSVKGLTVDQLLDAGIPRNIAEKAWESVNTPAHILAEQKKQALVKKLLETGLQPKTLKQVFADQMAKGVGIQGPSGATALLGGKTVQQWTNQLLKELKAKAAQAAKELAKAILDYLANYSKSKPNT